MKIDYPTILDLFAADSRAPLSDDAFDDALWFLLCSRISSPDDAAAFEKPVVHYYASRLIQWDVGNGGFAQAAYNYPEWFLHAAEGYDAIGKPESARLIREAIRLLPSERRELKRKGLFRATIGKLFDHFNESRMVLLNSRIVWPEWEIDKERVRYAKANAAAFCAVS